MPTARPISVSLRLALFVAACSVEVPRTAELPPAAKVEDAPRKPPTAAAPSVPPVVPAPAARPTASPFEVREPVPAGKPSFELVDAGAAPRAPVAIAAKLGDRVVLRVGLAMQVAMRVGTSDVPKTALPGLDVDLAAEVVNSSAEAIELALRVIDVHADDTAVSSERVKAAVEATVAALRSSTGTLVLAPNGRVQSIAMSSGGDAIESRAAGIDHALVELLPAWPREPIGVGARWKLVQPVVRGGVTLQRTSEYELLARRGDALELAVEASHVAVLGGDAAEGSTRIDAQSGEGRGRLEIAAGDVWPTRGAIAAHTTTRASFGEVARGVLVAIDLATSLARAGSPR